MNLTKRKENLRNQRFLSKEKSQPWLLTAAEAAKANDCFGLTPIPETVSYEDDEGYKVVVENVPGALGKVYTGDK
jgi:hypothetical protein